MCSNSISKLEEIKMNKAVFLDRDGVINEVLSKRVKFVSSVKDLYLLPWVAESIKVLNDLNYKVFIVTNQGGIGLGYMSENALAEIHFKLARLLLEEADAQIDDIAYCPHKPHANCHCRKPKPAMILELAQKHNIDLQQSFTIGDRGTDIVAGRLAGTRTILIIDKDEIIPVIDVDNVVFSLKEAVAWIVEISLSPSLR
jgi:D-glycero-D-manno-heptose 1,7-bisphosphate phosphatase